jgi:hypothetical protein
LVAENDKLQEAVAALRAAERSVEFAEKELAEAWRKLRMEQEEMNRVREREREGGCARSARFGMRSGDGEGHEDQGVNVALVHRKVYPPHHYLSPPPISSSYPASSDLTISHYQPLHPRSPEYQHIPSMRTCPQISRGSPEEVSFEDDCCAGVLDCEALAKMPQREVPDIRHVSTYPMMTTKETPFDPDCCSGLFDCNALSAIPPLAMDTGRSDLDILVDAATHATGVDER